MFRLWSCPRTALVGTTFSCLSLLAVDARADEVEPIRLTYDAKETCPARATFVAEVQGRTTRAAFVEEGARRTFEVRVGPLPNGAARGTLTVRASGRTSTRNVDGESCAEVVSAIALITALTIDPHATTTALPLPPVEPAPPPPDEPKPPPPPPVDIPAPTASVVPEVSPVDSVPVPPPPPVVREGDAQLSSLTVGVGPEAEIRTGLLPESAFLIGGLVVVSSRGRSLLAPSVRLSMSAAVTGQTADVAGAAVVVHWFGGRTELCPLRIALAEAVALRPCALFEIGRTASRGTGIADPKEEARPWFAGGASLGATWESGRFFSSIGTSLIAPLRRDRYYAGPSTTLYEVSPIGVGVGLTIGFVPLS